MASALPKDTEIRVWDSTAETRFLVLPMRPAGTEGWSEAQLAELVTRDSMIGTGFPKTPGATVMNGVHDMGGMDGFRQGRAGAERADVSHRMGSRVLAMVRAMGAAGAFNIDTSRFYREMLRPDVYLGSSYYKKWFLGLEDMLVDKGFISAEEVAAGHAMQPPKPLKRGKFGVDDVERVMVRGKFGRTAPAPARFKAGDRVRAKNIHPG